MIRPVDFYIKELLFDYDCVTVAGLGGFIAQSRPARLYRERRRIYPPSRVVTFNAMLLHDDGLLASFIAREEEIDYRSALKMIADFVGTARQNLETGKTINFEDIGSLGLNAEGGIVFQPLQDHNLSPATFGLDSFYVHPATIETVPSAAAPAAKIDRKPRPSREKTPASVRWTVALALPVIVFLLYGIIFPASYQEAYTGYSDMISGFFHKSPAHPAAIKAEIIEPEVKAVEYIQPEQIPVPQETINPEPVQVATVKTPVPEAAKTLSPKYYIIGGCFVDPENARKFKEQLKSKGFEAEEAGTNKKGQLRISYKSFQDRQEATSFLEQIKATENPTAWLLKY
jgi:hypothetical protein